MGNGLFVLVGTVMLGTFFFITLYLQETRGLTPLRATLAYLPVPLATLTGTRPAPRLIAGLGPRDALGVGLITQSVTFAWWAAVGEAHGHLALTLIAPTVLWAVGMGVSLVCSFTVCTGGVPEALTGAASGLASTSHQGGGAVGLALMAALAAATTRSVGDPSMPAEAVQLIGYQRAVWAMAVTACLGAVLTRALPDPGTLTPGRHRDPIRSSRNHSQRNTGRLRGPFRGSGRAPRGTGITRLLPEST